MGLTIDIYKILLGFDKDILMSLEEYFKNVSNKYNNYSIIRPGRYEDFNDYLEQNAQNDLNIIKTLLQERLAKLGIYFEDDETLNSIIDDLITIDDRTLNEIFELKKAYIKQKNYLIALTQFSSNGISLSNITKENTSEYLNLNRINQLQIVVNYLIKNYDSKHIVEDVIDSVSYIPTNQIDEIILDENLIGEEIKLMTQDENHIRWYYNILSEDELFVDEVNSDWVAASPVIYPHSDDKTYSKILIIKNFKFDIDIISVFNKFIKYVKGLQENPTYIDFINNHNAVIKNYKNNMELLKKIIDKVLNNLENEWVTEEVGLNTTAQNTQEWLEQRVSEQITQELIENTTLNTNDVKRVLMPPKRKNSKKKN